MFYETANNEHGLPRNPFKSCVVPRCIGWISSLSASGVVNLAPYSFFNAVSSDPPMVMFASGGQQPHGPKDSITNIEQTREFVCNLATWELREQMRLSSAPTRPEVDEFDYTGLAYEPAILVKPPRVKATPIHLECVYHQTVELPSRNSESRNAMLIGEVVGVHIRDQVLTDGLVDMSKLRPIARLGYMDYAVVDTVFSMPMPETI